VEYPNAELLVYERDHVPPKSIHVQKKVLFDGADIASVSLKRSGGNSQVILLKLTEGAIERLEVITSDNIGRRLAVVLDGTILSVSIIPTAISSAILALDVSSLDDITAKSIVARMQKSASPAKTPVPVAGRFGWSQAELALKRAMGRDPSYSRTQKHMPQQLAIEAWEDFLKRDDLTEGQRIFALWRVASLYACNMDSSLGEQHNFKKSKRLFKQVRDYSPGLLSGEIANTITMYASHPCTTDMEKASLLADNYRWVKTRTNETISNSAQFINRYGYLIDLKFFLPDRATLKDTSIQEKTEWLRKRLEDIEESMETMVAEFIKWRRQPEPVLFILESLEDVAPPDVMARWRSIESKFKSGREDLPNARSAGVKAKTGAEHGADDKIFGRVVDGKGEPAPDVQVEGEEGWGEVVDGLRVGMSMKKTSFAMDEPIQVQWRIKNVSQEDKTIIWHKLHYSPVVFEIGKSGGKKYIREDSRRMVNSLIPGPPEKLILIPGETKEAIFDLRFFGLNSSAERGTYEVSGLYSPQKASRLADYWLKRPEFKDCFTGQISSVPLKITLTDDTVWLQNQLRKGKFWDRLRAARRLAPIIGNKEVLAELEKMYPPGNTRHMVHLVDCMANLGDASHVEDVLDMHEAGGYAPHLIDYGGDMLRFLRRWGGVRGTENLNRYLLERLRVDFTNALQMDRKHILSEITDLKNVQESELPLLVTILDDQEKIGDKQIRWCDSAALAIQKISKRDWGFKLNFSEKERDEIITQMQAELADRVPVLSKVEPKVQFKRIVFPHGGGSSQGLMLAVNPVKESFRIDEDIVLGFYMHNPRGAIKLYCIFPDDLWQWTSLMIQDSHGKLLEIPIRKPADTIRPISKDDFFAIPPGKTIYWEQTFKKVWLPKGGLKPGGYKFFISINKAKTMSSCINGYDEFCRRYYLTDYKGTPETGPVYVKFVSGKDPADETLSERLERSFYFNPAQIEHKGKLCVSFYIHYGGVESLPKISVDDLVISRHIKSLSIADIPVEISDFDEDLPISKGRSRMSIYLPEEIKGLDSLKPGKYPVRLVLEGDIYKANNPDQPLEHWQVKLQEEIELNNLILEKGISGAQEDVNSDVRVED